MYDIKKHKMEEMFLRKERELQMQHDQAIHELEEDYEVHKTGFSFIFYKNF